MEADPRCGGVLQGVGSKMLRYVEIFSIFPSLSEFFFFGSRFFQRTKKKGWIFRIMRSGRGPPLTPPPWKILIPVLFMALNSKKGVLG